LISSLSSSGGQIFAYIKNENVLDINLERETDDGAIYIHTSRPGVSQVAGPGHEKRSVNQGSLPAAFLFRFF